MYVLALLLGFDFVELGDGLLEFAVEQPHGVENLAECYRGPRPVGFSKANMLLLRRYPMMRGVEIV